jgi:vancomycin resistance protein YoaR
VDQTAVQAFVQYLASQVDRQAENAKLSFAGTSVQIISPRLLGRTLDQQAATQRLLPIITGLRARARLRLPVLVTQPPVDTSNPASLGITTLLATGTTSFAGSDTARLDDITGIAKTLDQQLFNPGQDISFNTLMASTAWSDEVYRDQEIKQNGQLVPGSGAPCNRWRPPSYGRCTTLVFICRSGTATPTASLV